MDCSPPGSSVHEDSPGKNNGMRRRSLLQVIFPTQGLNPGLLQCGQILYCLSHQGSPRYWSGQLVPSPGDLPDSGIEPRSPALWKAFYQLRYQGSPIECVMLIMCVCVCVCVAQSCLIVCHPMDFSLPGFSVHGIFQARILEWFAISFSRRSS